MINRIQNKRFCLHNTCVGTVYVNYINIKAHTYSTYFENIYMYLHVYININIIDIIYKYIVRLVLCFVPLMLPYVLIWSFLFPVLL